MNEAGRDNPSSSIPAFARSGTALRHQWAQRTALW